MAHGMKEIFRIHANIIDALCRFVSLCASFRTYLSRKIVMLWYTKNVLCETEFELKYNMWNCGCYIIWNHHHHCYQHQVPIYRAFMTFSQNTPRM